MQQPFTPRVLNIKPRRMRVALLLSVFFPGLGQMYNGQFRKGLLFFGLLLALQVVYGFMHDSLSINGVFGFMVSILLLRALCILDAIRHARLQLAYTPKFYNTRGHYIVVMVIMALLMWYTKPNTLSGMKLLKIPTSSNNPTLDIGDWVVADKNAYNQQEPNYGDIVMYSSDGSAHAYRLVGLPGDTIALINNVLSINGTLSKQRFIGQFNTEEGELPEYEEQMPSGRTYRIIKFRQLTDSSRRYTVPIVVPPNSYFVLGDHRDNAADSRFLGCIPKTNIQGRLRFILWSKTLSRVGTGLE